MVASCATSAYVAPVIKTRLKNRMLSAISPEHEAPPPERWQQRKSAQTRQRLIEAGIDCLVEGGYARLTTAAVSERCGVSRGAMHHHFPTRQDLVSTVVEFVVYQRMRAFLEDYFALLRESGEESMVEVATQAHWRSVQSREYAAYLELNMAARTDADLAAVFLPAARRYDEVWTSEMIEAFPQWREQWEALKLASDFTNAMHMGLLLHLPILGDGARVQRMLEFSAESVKALHKRALDGVADA